SQVAFKSFHSDVLEAARCLNMASVDASRRSRGWGASVTASGLIDRLAGETRCAALNGTFCADDAGSAVECRIESPVWPEIFDVVTLGDFLDAARGIEPTTILVALPDDLIDSTPAAPATMPGFEGRRANPDVGKLVEAPLPMPSRRLTDLCSGLFVPIRTADVLAADAGLARNIASRTGADVACLNPGLLSCANNVTTLSSKKEATLIRREPLADPLGRRRSAPAGYPSGDALVAPICATACVRASCARFEPVSSGRVMRAPHAQLMTK